MSTIGEPLGGPLSQATAISSLAALMGFMLFVTAFRMMLHAQRTSEGCAVVDAWRAVMIFGLYSTVVFVSSIFEPRIYLDDFQGRGLRPEALWGGLTAILTVYCWHHMRHHAEPRRERRRRGVTKRRKAAPGRRPA